MKQSYTLSTAEVRQAIGEWIANHHDDVLVDEEGEAVEPAEATIEFTVDDDYAVEAVVSVGGEWSTEGAQDFEYDGDEEESEGLSRVA